MSFNALAPHYRWMELAFAGNQMQRCRTAFLDQLSGCRQVLIVGKGNGCFLAACLQQHPQAEITCIDFSSGMIEQARRRIEHQGLNANQVRFISADFFDWPVIERTYDAIVTHFFLDCFRSEQLARVIARLAAAGQRQACWLLADFRLPQAGWARRRAQAIVGLLYGFFRLTTGLSARRLTAPDAFLREHGFQLDQRKTYNWGLLHSDLWRTVECNRNLPLHHRGRARHSV